MRVTSLKLGGIGRFYDDLDLHIEELGDAKVVAITGTNGAGKTTALETIPGAIYKTTPSRGPLASLANRKDSFIELGVNLNGQPLLSKWLIDGVARKPQAFLYNSEGEPLTSGKVTDYLAKASKLFPAQDVFLSSAFAAQGGQGRFLDLKPSDRKKLFATLLGATRLEELAAKAGEKARATREELAGLKSRAKELETRAAGEPGLQAQLDTALAAVAKAEVAKQKAETQVQAGRVALEQWREELSRLQQVEMEARDRVSAAQRDFDRINDWLQNAGDRLSDIAGERARLGRTLGKRDKLKALVNTSDPASRLTELESQILALRQAGAEYSAAVSEWRRHKAVADQAKTRVFDLEEATAGLGRVPCHGEGEYSACPLIKSATRARDQLDNARRAVEKAEAAVGDEPSKPDTSQLQDLEREVGLCRATAQRITEARAKLAALADADERARALDTEAAGLRAKNTKGREALANAKRGVEEAQQAAGIAQGAVADCMKARPNAVDEREIEQLRQRETSLTVEATRIEESLRHAKEAAESLAEARAQVVEVTRDLDDWTHLQTALGKKGILAHEIDNACPEVSGLTNELLHACYGPRFSVSIETTELKADGKGDKEVLKLRVIDTERGTDDDATQLSGGEKVLVSEALALAIAIYNTRRSAISMEDLFRDECSGALSRDNAVLYIEMLRRAIGLGGFHRCYYVAHQAELWGLADARIHFEDGGCRQQG